MDRIEKVKELYGRFKEYNRIASEEDANIKREPFTSGYSALMSCWDEDMADAYIEDIIKVLDKVGVDTEDVKNC